MYIDTHLHLLKEYYPSIDVIIENAKRNHVDILIVSGCDKKSIVESVSLMNSYDNIYATIGYHPSEVGSVTKEDLDNLTLLIKNNKKIIGLGEIGLDYHYGKEDKEEQILLFRSQLDIAKEFDIPVVIHSRDAVSDTYNILKEYSLKGIVHCFSGSYETACNYIDLGYYLGIGGVVTFSNSHLPEVVKNISLANLVLETDSPYLAPSPYRGSVNEPSNIFLIANKISEIKNVTQEEVEHVTTSNVRHLFDFDRKL